MSDTPDLGKIISLIMENPDLISKIQGLAKGNEIKNATPTEIAATTEEKAMKTDAVINPGHDGKNKRKALLAAMKPYLSTERSKAIDSMMSVADILELMKSR